MSDIEYQPFAPPLPPAPARALPWMTVVAGSLVTVMPLVAPAPLLPPCGLLMLLAWRLLSRFALRPWAAAPLGLFDDLVSGQPLGSAVLLWSLCLLAIELVEQRLLFRTLLQDWAIATGLIAICLLAGRVFATPLTAPGDRAGRVFATPLTAPVDSAVAIQILASALLFPFALHLAAGLDAKRNRV